MFNFQQVRDVVRNMEQPVMSFYLQVSNELQENQADQPAWSIYVKNILRSNDQELNDKQNGGKWRVVRDRALAYFDGYQPTSRGLVAFFSANSEQIYELPIAPQENASSFGEPLIVPLLWLMDEFERYLVILIDQEQAQVFSTYLGDMHLERELKSDRHQFDFQQITLFHPPSAPQRTGGQPTSGSEKDLFDDMMQEWINRLYRDVAQKVREFVQREGRHRIIIGGAEKSAMALKDLLHEEVMQDFVTILPITMHDSPQQIIEKVLPAAVEYERKTEMELVNQVIDYAKAGGRAALGEKDVQDALEQQRVELLVMPWPGGGLDNETMQAYTLKAMESSSKFELVHGDAADRLMQEGKVGARLYYAVTPV
jgi:hypothetical protein